MLVSADQVWLVMIVLFLLAPKTVTTTVLASTTLVPALLVGLERTVVNLSVPETAQLLEHVLVLPHVIAPQDLLGMNVKSDLVTAQVIQRHVTLRLDFALVLTDGQVQLAQNLSARVTALETASVLVLPNAIVTLAGLEPTVPLRHAQEIA